MSLPLVERLIIKSAITSMLPLTAEGRRKLPCHPVSEMDVDEIERIIISTEMGFIKTESEDEVCDLLEYMGKHLLAKDYNFSLYIPTMSGYDDGSGPYLFAYEKKSLA